MPPHEQDIARRIVFRDLLRAPSRSLRPNRSTDGLGQHCKRRIDQTGEAQFDVFVTVDRGILYQQNLRSTKLGFIVLRAQSNRLEDLLPLVSDMLAVLAGVKAGDIVQLELRTNLP